MAQDRQPGSERAKSPRRHSAESSDLLAMWLATFSQLYHQEIEELAALAYRETLKNYSAEQIDRGCREVVRRCAFIPKPSEIIEAIRSTGTLYPTVRQLPEPPQSGEEIAQFFAEAREKLGGLLRQVAERKAV